MSILRSGPARPAVTITVAVLLAGCQSYQPHPINLAGHHRSWVARSGNDATVQAFVDRLAGAGRATGLGVDPGDGLSLAEAELVALVYNPDLRLARLRVGVARATAEYAGRWDDPTLSVDVLRITESVPDPWVVTPGLTVTIPLSGRLAIEQDRADAALRAEVAAVAEQEWAVRWALQEAWLAWSAASIQFAEQAHLLDDIAALASATARLAEAGELPRTEAALFEIELIRRRADRRRLEGVLWEREQQLRHLMGLSPTAMLELQPTLDAPQGASTEAFEARLGGHPTLVRLQRAYDVAEQTLRREVRKQFPDLTFGPLYESDQGQSRVGLSGAIPLPLFNANRGGIAEARAQREVARAALEVEYDRLWAEWAQASARAEALADQRHELLDVLAPRIDSQLDDAQRLLKLGESGGLILLESLVRAYETKLDVIEVRRDEALAHFHLHHLMGPAQPALAVPPSDLPAEPVHEVTP